ncbi:MAG: helix-turn-helix transcriptional regulator [Acidobacteriota bacterium]
MSQGLRNSLLINKLTEREKEVLRLLADGYSNEETADILQLSRRTVESHRAHIILKLQMSDLAGLVKYAILNGLTSIEQHRSYEMKRTVAEAAIDQ